MMDRTIKIRRLPALLLAAAMPLTLFACDWLKKPVPGPTRPDPTQVTVPAAGASFAAPAYKLSFGAYEDYAGNAKAQAPAYSVSPGLANIVNRAQFLANDDESDAYYWYHSSANLSKEAVALIEKNGFAVTDGKSWAEYFGVYEQNRYSFVPSFVTTDSAVHTFHLMFDYVLKDLEQNLLYPALIDLANAMLEAAQAQYAELKDGDFGNAALRNVAYFAVARQLLNPKAEPPAEASELVAAELKLIKALEGPAPSPVINLGATYEDPRLEAYQADYSQFAPRSHYTQTGQLERYFQAMQWLGQMTFRSKYEDEVKSALLLTSALYADGDAARAWTDIYEPTTFFVGESDDITPFQYRSALGGIYGDLGDLDEITNPAKFAAALEWIGKMRPPRINSVPIFEEVEDRDAAVTGLRFMGQRFTVDAAIFQRLMDREVPERMLPNSLDIPAALGSAEAAAILKPETGKYPEYGAQMGKVESYLKGLPGDAWHENLYWSWLHMLRPLAGERKGAGYPFFMRNDAWLRKELNTFQGSWTELKRDTLLYAKQPMAEMGDGGDDLPEPPDDRGYVEPNPAVYARLAALVKLTTEGLRARKLLTGAAEEALDTLCAISEKLTAIAEKELENKALTEKEYDFIRTYGGELEHIWQTAKKDEVEAFGEDQAQFLMFHPDAVVADVATDPNGLALTEATGYGKEIYVAFPRDGKVALARGVVYSQYEFTVPLSGRLTDEAWHQRLRDGDIPPFADWKGAFLADITDDHSGDWAMTY
ncbi:MAG: DUF3160 domain-containing protein [Oscillospiraceae bacterium]|jgi:hypothetical protein|nr:DUF3160 domain-containing protein [Oscillospiraceae bacterium]